MNEINILFIQESLEYCTSIVQMLSSDDTIIHSEQISDSSYIGALSRKEWNIIIGDEALLRAGSPDIDTFTEYLRNSIDNIPLIVITNHNNGTSHFFALSSLPGAVRKDTAEELTATIKSVFNGQDSYGDGALDQTQSIEKVTQHKNKLDLANRRLLAEIHERRKAEIALKRSDDKLRLAYDDLEKRVMERTAELAQTEKESRELFGLLDKMFSTTKMLIAYLDTDLNYVSVNMAFAEVNGLDPSHFIGKHYLDLCPIPEHAVVFKKVIATGKSYNAYEQRFVFPAIESSISTYWDWYVEPSFTDDGHLDGIIIGLINVTDRIHSQVELRQSEQRLADAQRIAHMGSWIYDAGNRTLECSDEFFRIFNLRKRRKIPLQTLLKRIHPEDLEKLLAGSRKAVENRKPFHLEHRIVLPDGNIKIAEMQFEVIAEGDTLISVRGVTHDITSLRRAEQSRREIEERLRSFIDSATDSFLLFDKNFNLIEINSKAAVFLGGKREDLLGRNILEIMPDTDSNGQYTLYKRVLETGDPVYFDNFIGKSGPGNRYYYQQAFRAGEDLGIIFTEITDRKHYENTLLHKQHQLEIMLKRETLLSWVAARLNSPGSFQVAMQDLLHTLATELHLGMAAAWPESGDALFVEVLIKHDEPVFSPLFIKNLHTMQSLNSPGQRLIINDVRDLPEDEKRYFNPTTIKSAALFPAAIAAKTLGYLCFCDVKPHDWHDEEIYLLGTAADIIASAWERQNQIKARAEADQQRIEALQMAEKVSRMASIGEIAGGITHEINQPLTAIKVSADSIRFWNKNNKHVLPEKFITMIDKISLSVDRISEIVRHMRAFWVSPSLVEHSAVDLNTIVERALSLLNRQLHSHRIKPVVKLSGDELIIMGNPIHLEQILINLLVNSMYALDHIERRDKYIMIETRENTGKAILSVADNGIGLPPEAGNKIYDPFYSTRKPGEGTGLGLAITKRFVEAHHGDIRAGANKPNGAVFTIRFPLQKSKEESHEYTAC